MKFCNPGTVDRAHYRLFAILGADKVFNVTLWLFDGLIVTMDFLKMRSIKILLDTDLI